jgi:hypothetical protein
MGHVVPKQIVGPAAPVSGRADVRQAMREEAAMREGEPLGSVREALAQRNEIGADAQRMHDAESRVPLLGERDDGRRIREAQRERDLDEDVLAVLERASREIGVLLARVCEHDEVDVSGRHRLVEVDRRAGEPARRRERTRVRLAAPDQHLQSTAGTHERPRVPGAHHPVAHEAGAERRTLPIGFESVHVRELYI